MNVDDVLYLMPGSDGGNTVNHADGNNGDIIHILQSNFEKAVAITRKCSKLFRGRNDTESAKNVWNFLKENIRYEADGEESQKIRLPNRLLKDGEGDCKSLALFALALLYNLGLHKCCFKYASYHGSSVPSHVYCVAVDESGRQIVVDAVYDYFNKEKLPITKSHTRCMKISTLTGLGAIDSREDAAAAIRVLIDRYNTLGVESSSDRLRIKKWIEELRSSIGNTSSEVRSPTRTEVRSPTRTSTWANTRGNITVTGGAGRGATYVILPPGDGMGNVWDDIWHGTKKATLWPNRNAFLELVALNVRNVANALDWVKRKNPGELEKQWYKWGGKMSQMDEAINKGKSKKPPLGWAGNAYYPSAAQEAADAANALALAAIDLAKRIYPAAKPGKLTDMLKAIPPELNDFYWQAYAALKVGNTAEVDRIVQLAVDWRHTHGLAGLGDPYAIAAIIVAAGAIVGSMTEFIVKMKKGSSDEGAVAADMNTLWGDVQSAAAAAGITIPGPTLDPSTGGTQYYSTGDSGFSISSIPWWGWAGAAAAAYFLFIK